MNQDLKHHRLATLLSVVFTAAVHAQTTSFTYQGSLTDSGTPANGVYDLRFELFDASVSGVSVGTVTNHSTEVDEGLFTVALDFGPDVFDGNERWLEIGVVTNAGGPFTTLNPRQPITSNPYAIKAADAMTVKESGRYKGVAH